MQPLTAEAVWNTKMSMAMIVFTVGIGAEAIRDLLAAMDLEKSMRLKIDIAETTIRIKAK